MEMIFDARSPGGTEIHSKIAPLASHGFFESTDGYPAKFQHFGTFRSGQFGEFLDVAVRDDHEMAIIVRESV
jgi:hypothetical protein